MARCRKAQRNRAARVEGAAIAVPTRRSPLLCGRQLERTKRTGDELAFGRTGTESFAPNLLRKRVMKAWAAENVKRAEAELPPLVPIALHELRHTFSTFLDHAGVSADRADR